MNRYSRQLQYEMDFYKNPAERRILSFRNKDRSLDKIIREDYFEADCRALASLYRKGKIWYEDGEVCFCG